MGFHSYAQAIETAVGCVQCSAVLCTGKVCQDGFFMQHCLDLQDQFLFLSPCPHILVGEVSPVPHCSFV